MRHFIKTLVICVATILIVGCSNEEEKIPSQSSMEFKEDGQGLKIIPLYEEVLDYTNDAKENTKLNNSGEYYSKVTKPFQEYVSNEEASLTGGIDYSNYFIPTRSADLGGTYSRASEETSRN